MSEKKKEGDKKHSEEKIQIWINYIDVEFGQNNE